MIIKIKSDQIIHEDNRNRLAAYQREIHDLSNRRHTESLANRAITNMAFFIAGTLTTAWLLLGGN